MQDFSGLLDIGLSTNMVAVRHYSITNPWIDFVVIVPAGFERKAAQAISDAMDAFWVYAEIPEEGFECYGDALYSKLNSEGIPYCVVFHSSEDESAEYEDAWNDLISQLNPKLLYEAI